jgi:deazaflavin-dependent oxidoreductase (nitroreductase family)
MSFTGEYEPSPFEWVRDHVERYERSGGTAGAIVDGMAIVLLTTVGAKTGMLRKTPLMRVEHQGEYAIVASFGGAAKNPVWYFNVVAEPSVQLRDGAVQQNMLAREVHGEERVTWWARAVESYPTYAEYQKKTDREIPVLVLKPAAA